MLTLDDKELWQIFFLVAKLLWLILVYRFLLTMHNVVVSQLHAVLSFRHGRRH